MGNTLKGAVVVIPFPFSDLSGSKRRPAFVLADLSGEDIILCQITSKAHRDALAVPLTAADFVSGGLPLDSFVRPNKVFTADRNIILYVSGRLSDEKAHAVSSILIQLIQ